MSLITLKNVKKEYGKNQVLFENLSLEIEKGEFVGLVEAGTDPGGFVEKVQSVKGF